MTAAILASVNGPEWMGQLRRTVQDGDYIQRLAEQLLSTEPLQISDPARPRVARTAVDRWLRNLQALHES